MYRLMVDGRKEDRVGPIQVCQVFIFLDYSIYDTNMFYMTHCIIVKL